MAVRPQGPARAHRVPDPRGDAVRTAAAMIRDGAPLADVADALRAGAEGYVEIALQRLTPLQLVSVRLLVGMLPEAVQLAGLVPSPPPPPPADPDADLWADAAGGIRSPRSYR